MAGNFDKEEFVGIFHHVFLPPQLPQKADDKSDIPLLRMIVTALSDLQAILPRAIAIGNALEALKALQIVNSLPDGAISEPALSQRLEALRTGQVIPVHVRSQNAAIMITCKTDQVVFEEFELSPANEAVMTTKGRLIRTFPGLAVAVDAGEFKLTDLASTVGHTLATMCQQPVPEMQPQSKKAGSSNDELRDTTMPAAVSELFFGFLRGFGQGVPVTGISKNTREEVLWKDAKAPWRRSPMWLLIRIVLQLNIERSSDGSRSLYKEATTFVMAQVLKTALQYDVDSEAMYIMSAKIVRRLHKSREAAKLTSREISGAVEASINDVLQQASSTLADRWKVIQLKDGRELDLAALSLLDFEADTHADLPELEKYIMELQSHQDEAERASFSPSSALIKHSPDTLPRLPSSNSEESCYATANLQQFEQWISTYLDRWVLSNLHEGTCEALYQLMLDYHRLATEHYTRNPEATSVMLLTMFELWIACDRVAVSINPLLAEYNPEIPPGILQDMLLPFYYQMERLVVVESYLENRAATSPYKHSTMLFETHSAASFAIRFFDQSASHQGLLAEIQQQANQTRLAKRREFETTKSEYHEFNAIYSQTSCAFFTKIIDRWTDPPETEQQHAHDCKKCLYKRKRDALKITVHEWPLPHDPREAKAIVFEADVPPWLSFWRDARLFILQDVLKGECDAVESTSSYRLSQTDPHLSRQYFRGSRSHRVDLLSVCKPFTVSHYREKKMTSALLESDVCVANGLRYKYYDATSGRYIGNLEYGDSVARSCTYTLSNKQLQDCIFRQSSSPDGSTPNTVIANQDTCPDNMTLEEFKDLASIPLGHHIQWANMMVQLAMPSVDFKKVDTTLVFLQCIYQTGPPNGEAMREAHSMFRAGTRVGFVLEHVKAAIERIKQNWESAQALSLFVAILTRTLSLHSAATDGRFQALIDSCIELLTSARKVALGWMFALRDRAHAATEEKDRNGFISKSVEVALILL
ncbi:hypothetical protein B0A50_07912 [Salinomyces thailandicus]|uniref:DUF6606 domain-containing protein n=1 Tax=Salinomyces thailandicus TaxID=706561 RepID=A0A4U0TL13_9PEZI|nr:hypothetical protein B0A50_07912 [Salinomyces thailandica]